MALIDVNDSSKCDKKQDGKGERERCGKLA
jgi:hypothetical protein